MSYKEFLKQEKEFSTTYLKNLQIFDERFNEYEYEFLKLFFNNIELINNLNSIVEDLVKYFKYEKKIKFLIIGDFLFSMFSYDIKDPSEIIFKTSRNDYINRINIRAKINKQFNLDFDTYILLHKKLLIGLCLTKVLKKFYIREIRDGEWRTGVYFQINLENNFLKHEIPIGFSEVPFILFDLEESKYLLSSFRNIWKVKRKKREMEEYPISYDSIKKASQIKFVLCENIFKINQKFIKEEENSLLKECNCKNINEYFKKIINIVKDEKYVNKIFKGEERILNVNKYDINNLIKETKNESKILFSNFQKLISIFILNNLINKSFYLPCFMDNRGRQYYATLISPTFYKIFRFLYQFNNKKKFVGLEDSIFYKKIIKYENKVKYLNLDKKNTYILIVLFIEVGKHFVENKNEFIEAEEFIEKGIENYTKKNLNLKFEDILYVNKIYNLLDDLIKNKKIDNNSIIFKDATASGLQNYGLILGYKKDKLKYLNMEGDAWCDTYLYIINKFLKDSSGKYSKRKYWKSTIMTIPYNAEWFTCFKKFLEKLREDGIEYFKLNKEEQDYLKKIHHQFYTDVKNKIKEEFYENEIKNDNLIIFKYNKWEIRSRRDYKINYKEGRDKYTEFSYNLLEDEETTKRALEANNTQHKDSKLVEKVLEKHEVLTVHDCFGVRLCELHLLMDTINDYYSKWIKKKTYNIFIIK